MPGPTLGVKSQYCICFQYSFYEVKTLRPAGTYNIWQNFDNMDQNKKTASM